MEIEQANLIRSAPLSGHFSWSTLRKVYVHDNSFEKQTPNWWAIISARLYKKFRVVWLHNKIGVVLLEDDDEAVVDAFLDSIPRNAVVLHHGDAVSRVTGMGRHWAIFDAETDEGVFWEYQGPEPDSLGKSKQVSDVFNGTIGNVLFTGTEGTVQKTSYQKFMEHSNDLDLQVEDLSYKFSRQEAVQRAREKDGLKFYHLLYNNCESFVRWVITDQPVSQQSLSNIDKYTNLAKGVSLTACAAIPSCLLIKYGGIGVAVRLALHSIGVPLFGPVYPMVVTCVSVAAGMITPLAIAMRKIKQTIEAGPVHIYGVTDTT